MSTKTVKKTLVSNAAALEKICAWAPKGWKFHRATYTTVDNGDKGVRVFFENKPIGAPVLKLKKEAESAFPRKVAKIEYLQGEATVKLTFDDGTDATVASAMVGSMVDLIPERRPKIRLLTPKQLQDHELLDLLIRAKSETSGSPREMVMLDVLIPDATIRELFSLGENVAIQGVRGDWKGEPIAGRGVCSGFSVLVREAV